MTLHAQILFPVNVTQAFDYIIPPDLSLALGDFVYAPFGKQAKLGVVMGLDAPSTDRALKTIAQLKAAPPLPRETLEFIKWTARYNCAAMGNVLRMVLRSVKALEPSAVMTYYQPSADLPQRMSAARRAILEQGGPFPQRAAVIAQRAGVSAAVVRGLAKAGGLEVLARAVDPPFDPPNPDLPPKMLTQAQKEAAQDLIAQVDRETFNVSLLDGVTGSGKTEVYLEAAAQALRKGSQVLILVPEIALTQASLSRFETRFGTIPAAWHSAMGQAARRRVWREVAQGRAQLIVGARSALYLPFTHLGLIIVDEEHDTSYKQDEGVLYNARDMAVIRGKIGNHAVILASATPSLESLHNAYKGKFAHIRLPERPGAITLPDIDLVDLRDHPPEKGQFLSAPLIAALTKVIQRKEQGLLYLNRRGFAPLIICRSCGEKLKSPDTDSWLVAHKASGRAMCHLTGFSMPMPKACLKCRAEDSLTAIGPGVERIADEARLYFPKARIEIFSSDTAGNPQAIKERMQRMEGGEIDILVGTQMVVKGHNFPHLTFVGVVDGDLGLAGGDPRAGERSYQTLAQVAGRAGRADKPGYALIQTHQPEHEALQALAAGDRDLFIGVELAMREMLGLPPFGRLAAVIMSGPDSKELTKLAQNFLNLAPKADGIEILGPSEAPIARLRGQFRQRLFIQAQPQINLSKYMRVWRERFEKDNPVKRNYRFQIDIDPQNFL